MSYRVIGWCAIGNNCANAREGRLSLFGNCAHGEETFATMKEAEARIEEVVGWLECFSGPDGEQMYHALDRDECGSFELQREIGLELCRTNSIGDRYLEPTIVEIWTVWTEQDAEDAIEQKRPNGFYVRRIDE